MPPTPQPVRAERAEYDFVRQPFPSGENWLDPIKPWEDKDLYSEWMMGRSWALPLLLKPESEV